MCAAEHGARSCQVLRGRWETSQNPKWHREPFVQLQKRANHFASTGFPELKGLLPLHPTLYHFKRILLLNCCLSSRNSEFLRADGWPLPSHNSWCRLDEPSTRNCVN